jgi:mannose-1-phosphate guanylyltransferase
MTIDPSLHVVIMAGGSGTRFWPLSRKSRPKQFLCLFDDRSLLQETWSRAVGVTGDADHVWVVTSASYADLTREQLPELDDGRLLLEPQARNTAPCLAWAAAELAAREPESVMLVLPADHVIHDVRGFGMAVQCAAAAARQHRALVTFGVPPRYAETGYGYVEVGEPLTVEGDGPRVPTQKVASFREKPDLDTARRYVDAGSFLWNSGMFVWRTDVLLEEIGTHLPDALDAARRMVAADGEEAREDAYAAMPATSIDYGVMEREGNVACVRAPFDSSDVGSWAALRELLGGDADGNVARGEVVTLDARRNMVHAPGEVVALLGVDDLAIVRAGDVLLVAGLERSQDIKELRERIAAAGLGDRL